MVDLFSLPSSLIELLSWSFQADDSGLASYVAGQIDRTLSWQVCKIIKQSILFLHFYPARMADKVSLY